MGVGTVLDEAKRFDATSVVHYGIANALSALPLQGTYRQDGDQDDDMAEWAVPVEWTHAIPREQAFWKPGMFANQSTAEYLRR